MDEVFFYAKVVGTVRHIVQNHAEPLVTNDVSKNDRRNIVTPKKAKKPGVKLSESEV